MDAIEILPTAGASPELLNELRHLLEAAFPAGFSEHDWAHTLGGNHIVALRADRVVSHAAVIKRAIDIGDRRFSAGYVESVATHPKLQGQGLGAAVMAKTTELIRGRFELGALSTGLPDFYGRFAWELWQGPTFARSSTGLIRTSDDDGGIMVLRFGPSATIDLTSPISCEARSGDHW